MFQCSIRWFKNLTDETVTKQLTSRYTRRPNKLVKKIFEDRIRKQRRQRAQFIREKEALCLETLSSTTDARDIIMAQLADQIFSKGHKFLSCATNISYIPDGNPAVPEVALAGRGLVGKTSLLRSLFRDSREVGRSNRKSRRDSMNFFSVGNVFNIVDLPGFGGTSVPWYTTLQHAVLLRNFCRSRPSLKMLYYCMDVHYKNGLYIQDIDILKFLSEEVRNFTIVITKADQINESDRATNHFRLEDIRKELLFNDIEHPVLPTSAHRMGGIDALRYDMVMNCLHALPTERLTYSEAKRLSERLFSQLEMSTVRSLPIPPTELEEETKKWELEAMLENKISEASGESPVLTLNSPTLLKLDDPLKNLSVFPDEPATDIDVTISGAKEEDVDSSADGNSASKPLGDQNDPKSSSSETPSLPVDLNRALQQVHSDQLSRISEERKKAFLSLKKKVENSELLAFVRRTSPWRNSLLWPPSVVPTKHPKSNILRCPEDPGNPYLFQARFVAPRADMHFRRPNVGIRKSSQKGRYEPDKPIAHLLKEYTIPFFPDIVDVSMRPQPWAFVGSREAYFERSGGRQLGIRMLHYATKESLNPLSDSPAPHNKILTNELKALEAKRFSSEPIAFLKPPPDRKPIIQHALADNFSDNTNPTTNSPNTSLLQ